MAPEVTAGEEPGRAADVHALGVILHPLVCGRLARRSTKCVG